MLKIFPRISKLTEDAMMEIYEQFAYMRFSTYVCVCRSGHKRPCIVSSKDVNCLS